MYNGMGFIHVLFLFIGIMIVIMGLFCCDLQILAGLLCPVNGSVYVEKPKSFVFQNPDHQVGFSNDYSP